MSGKFCQGRTRMAFGIARNVKGVQSVYANQQYVLDFMSCSKFMIRLCRGRNRGSQQAKRKCSSQNSFFQVNLLCGSSQIGTSGPGQRVSG
jgi:hypothetical protein